MPGWIGLWVVFGLFYAAAATIAVLPLLWLTVKRSQRRAASRRSERVYVGTVWLVTVCSWPSLVAVSRGPNRYVPIGVAVYALGLVLCLAVTRQRSRDDPVPSTDR